LQIHFEDFLESAVVIPWSQRRGTMRPKKPETTEGDLFRARLDQIINLKHELVQLGTKIDWDWIDREIAPLYSEKGRPGIESRFVIGLLLLKHIYGLSDEGVCQRWVYDPYFQHFTGFEFFQHEFPHERSDLSHWRKRLGSKLELLLAESLRVAHQTGALRTRDLKRVTVDTTVQPKAITFPTDAKLVHAAIRGLNRLARAHGLELRQSYRRIAKQAAMMAGRYAHAKQFKLTFTRSTAPFIASTVGRPPGIAEMPPGQWLSRGLIRIRKRRALLRVGRKLIGKRFIPITWRGRTRTS
jgi:Transposase domain (DUF772)